MLEEAKSSSVAVKLETCFAAVNRCPNCVKWINSNYFVIAAFRTLVLYSVRRVSATITTAAGKVTLNGHDFLISCVESNCVNNFALVASGDKNGNLILWKLKDTGTSIEFVSKSILNNVHQMTINCIKLLIDDTNSYLFSCAGSSIKVFSVKWMSLDSSDVSSNLVATVDLGRSIAFQLDAVFTVGSSLFLFAALDDCRLHVFLCDNFKDDPTDVRKVFRSEAFDDWIRGISILYLTDSVSQFVNGDTILVAVSSQDTFIQIFTLYAIQSPDGVNDVSSTEIGMRKTLIKNANGEVTWNIYPESILSAHTDKVFSVQFLPYGEKDVELGLLSSSFDRSVVLWSYDLTCSTSKLTGGVESDSRLEEANVWQDVMRVGDLGGNDLGFYGAQMSPNKEHIIAYNYTGSLVSWCSSSDDTSSPSAKSYSNLSWRSSLTSSGHFYPPTSVDWNPDHCAVECDSKSVKYFVTCGKDKIVRAVSQIELEDEGGGKTSIWQEVARPQIHGYEMNCLKLLNDVTLVSCGDEKILRVFDCTHSFTSVFDNFCPGRSLQIPQTFELSKTVAVPALGLSNKAVDDRFDEQHNVFAQKMSFDDQVSPVNVFTNAHLAERTLWGEKIKLYGHGNEVFSVTSFCSDCAKLIASASKATSSETACILLWVYGSTSDKVYLADSIGGLAHTLTVTDLNFSPDGNFLLSVSRDRSICVFAVLPRRVNEKQSYTLALQHKVEFHKRIIWKSCWLSSEDPSHYKFLTGSRDKTIVLWKFSKNSQSSFDWIKSTSQTGLESGDCTLSTRPEKGCSQSFSSGVTALDGVHIGCDQISSAYHLVCAGLENGQLFLAKLVDDSEIVILHTFDSFSSHVLDVNSVKFSCRSVNVRSAKSEEESDEKLWLTTLSNDHIVKLFKIDW